MAEGKAVVWFNEVTKDDVALVGGKGANLGEMTNAHIPVPPGFIVTANAYYDFLQSSKVIDEIRRLLKPLDPDDSKQLQQTAAKVQQVILNATMPPELADEIKEAYTKMGGGLVAVRSSATAEDLPEASFAGQQRTFLNVQGEREVVAAVQGAGHPYLKHELFSTGINRVLTILKWVSLFLFREWCSLRLPGLCLL